MGFYVGGKIGPLGYSKSLSTGYRATSAVAEPVLMPTLPLPLMVIGVPCLIVGYIVTGNLINIAGSGQWLMWGFLFLLGAVAVSLWIVIPVWQSGLGIPAMIAAVIGVIIWLPHSLLITIIGGSVLGGLGVALVGFGLWLGRNG